MNAWAFYDWANSVHALVITTAIFPIYYASQIYSQEIDGDKYIELFGFLFNSSSLITYTGAAAFLIICLTMPLLTGLADYTDSKKKFLRFFCYFGSAGTIGLYWFSADNLAFGLVMYMIGLIGFWSSVVFYNSHLPLIAHKDQMDRLSAKGFALGYIGSAILLILCLVMYLVLGWDIRISFILTGIWWIGFAQITLRRLPSKVVDKESKKGSITAGYKELRWVWSQLRKTRRLRKYLRAFFIYSMGVQTVMLVAVYFGEEEIAWSSQDAKTTGLIISILLIQFIAIGGAYTMSSMAKKWGNITTLIIVNAFWVLLCVVAMFITTPMHFYLCAVGVGFVMGGIQSISRSTYAKFLPETTDTASFFSFYDVSEKLGIVIGLFTFAFLEEAGNMRISVGALAVFFIVGLLLLFRIPKTENELHLDH